MADTITKCVSFYDGEGNVTHRVLHYRLESGNYSKLTSLVVTAKEMIDPNDLDECKTLGNAKVVQEKNRWINELITPAGEEEEISDINGPVSL